MSENRQKVRDWDGTQWVGGRTATATDAETPGTVDETVAEPRWNKTEWVGDQGRGSRAAPQAPEDMPEGEPGLSGSRHNPGAQHWATDYRKKDRQGK